MHEIVRKQLLTPPPTLTSNDANLNLFPRDNILVVIKKEGGPETPIVLVSGFLNVMENQNKGKDR